MEKIPENDAKNLPDLTDSQYRFVLGLLEGKTASDAYRAAYNAEKMAPSTLWARASNLKAHSKVRAWLENANQLGLRRAGKTREQWLRETEEIRDKALAAGAFSAATKAQELIAKANPENLLVEVSEQRVSVGDEELLKAIETLLGQDLAREAARRLGYEIEENTQTIQ